MGNKVKGKKPDPVSRLLELRQWMRERAACWLYYRDHGGQDPFWQDGANMNLIRNQMIACRNEIQRICAAEGWPLPEEFFIPIPDRVDNTYMADPDSPRMKTIGGRATHCRIVYDPDERKLF